MSSVTPLHKNDMPESFGVFKPVGHVVLAFKDPGDLDAARADLTGSGYAPGEFVHLKSNDMRAQIERELQQASGAAGFGHELNVLKLHRQLAEQGHDWLIVHAPQEAQWTEVARAAQQHHAAAAHRYGRLVVEDLLVAPGEQPGL